MFSCGEPVNLPLDRVWAANHVRYHARGGDPVCATVAHTLERHARLVLGYFKLPVPSDFVLDYYKYSDLGDLKRSNVCPERASACASGTTVWSARALDRHELTHAYLSSLGPSNHVLEEGVAVALACEPMPASGTLDVTWRDAFQAPYADFDELSYAAAGRFVGYLLNHLGPERFLDLYREVGRNAPEGEILTTFQRVYGLLLTETWAEAMATQNPELGCSRLWECSGPSLELGQWQALGTECSQGDSFRTVEVEREAAYVYQSIAGERTRLVDCNPNRTAPHEAWSEPTRGDRGAFLLPLEPGRYFLTSFDPGWSLRVDGPHELVASSCEDAIPVEVLAANFQSGARVFLDVPSSRTWFSFPDLDLVANELLLETASIRTIRTCRACEAGEPVDCVTWPSPRSASFIPTSRNLWLEVEARDDATVDSWFRLSTAG